MPDKALNAFALILLAFPFYLAISGRLIAYTSLATSTGSQASAGGASSSGAMSGAVSPLPALAVLPGN